MNAASRGGFCLQQVEKVCSTSFCCFEGEEKAQTKTLLLPGEKRCQFGAESHSQLTQIQSNVAVRFGFIPHQRQGPAVDPAGALNLQFVSFGTAGSQARCQSPCWLLPVHRGKARCSGLLASFLSLKMRGISAVTKIRNRK